MVTFVIRIWTSARHSQGSWNVLTFVLFQSYILFTMYTASRNTFYLPDCAQNTERLNICSSNFYTCTIFNFSFIQITQLSKIPHSDSNSYPHHKFFKGGWITSHTMFFLGKPPTYWMCPLRQNIPTSSPPFVASDPRAECKGWPEILPGGEMSGSLNAVLLPAVKTCLTLLRSGPHHLPRSRWRPGEPTNHEGGTYARLQSSRRGSC